MSEKRKLRESDLPGNPQTPYRPPPPPPRERPQPPPPPPPKKDK